MVFILKYFVLAFLNYLIFITSKHIDTLQLIEDLNLIFSKKIISVQFTYLLTSICVATITLLLTRIFRPFIEIYLLHYSRYFFYVLVCLLSLSSVYIVLRIYGYSRLSLVIYIFLSSLFLTYSVKISKFYS